MLPIQKSKAGYKTKYMPNGIYAKAVQPFQS